MRDLLVAGGGPVGLAVALHADRAGLDVAVLEPRRGPVDKACGEGLMPGALALLAELGVDPAGMDLHGIRYVDGARSAEARFGAGPGRGVRRTVLHAALAERVAAAGVPVLESTVRGVENRADHVVVDGEPARHLVAADGLHSPVRRMLGLDRPGTGARRFGQRLHVATAPWSSFVEVHWAAHAEAYVTPVGPDLVGVAVLTSERGPFADVLAGFPALAARLAGGERSGVRGAGPLRQAASRRVAGRVLLAGDAAGYVDALTGEGLALGLAEARAAVEAIVADRVETYDATSRRLRRRHELLTRALLEATRHAPVRRHLVAAAGVLPPVFGAAVNALARPA